MESHLTSQASSSNVFCGPCEAQDFTKPAANWCPECEEGLCIDCQKHHSVSKATRSHGVISVENYKKIPTSISGVVQHCEEHNMRHQHYCPKHDQICCPVCVSTSHKKCTDLQAISELIKTSKTSTLLSNMEQSLQDIKNNIDQVIKNRKENLSTIERQREKFIDDVKKMRIKINSHLDRLEQKIRNELLATEKQIKDKIQELLTQTSTTSKKVEELQNSVLAVKEYASDLQTFFGSKDMEVEVDKIEKYLKSLQEDGSLRELSLKFTMDEKLSDMMSQLTSFGTVSEVASPPSVILKTEREKQAQIMTVIQPSPKTIHDFKLTLVSNYDIPKGKYTSDVRGCTCLPDGTIVLTNCSGNNRLVILDRGSYQKEIQVTCPYDVTTINHNLVAVSTCFGIDVIELASGDTVKHIHTNNIHFGITSFKEQILWCEQSLGIRTAELSCDIITTLVRDKHIPKWAYIAACGEYIYTSNPKTQTVTCYQNNKELWNFKENSIFKYPFGITIDSQSNVFITSRYDNKVVVISPDGTQGRVLLTAANGIKEPWGIYYDNVRSSLIVVNNNGTVFNFNVAYT